MLEHLNKINVRPGDGILVPAGQAHATGAGVFLVEVQEPTDFSILLEWSVTTATRDESHLGLGFDVVLPAVSHRALPAPEPVHVGLDARAPDLLRGLPQAADPFFRVDIAAADAVPVPHGFAVAVVLEDGAWSGPTAASRSPAATCWPCPTASATGPPTRPRGRLPPRRDLAGGGLVPRTVKEVMTTRVVSVLPDDPATRAVDLLRRYGFSALPVADRGYHLVGMISLLDVLRWREAHPDAERPRGRRDHDPRRALDAALGEAERWSGTACAPTASCG